MQLPSVFTLVSVLGVCCLLAAPPAVEAASVSAGSPCGHPIHAPPPASWELVDTAADPDGDVRLRVVVAVRQTNMDVVEKLFHEVSDPDSPRYGHFLSHDQLAAIVAPVGEHIAAARAFMRTTLQADAVKTSPHGEFVNGTTTVGRVRDAFPGTSFATFRHRRSGIAVVRATTRLCLPPSVDAAADLVTGLWDLPLLPDHLRSIDGAAAHGSSMLATAASHGQAARHGGIGSATRPRPAASKAEAAAPGSSIVPLIEFGESGNHRLVVMVVIDCFPAPNCSASFDGPFTVTATPTNGKGASYTANFTYAAPQCQGYQCTFTVTNVPNYQVFTMSVSVLVNGTKASNTFPIPLAGRPWSIPQTVHKLYNVPKSLLDAPKHGEDGVILWGGEYASLPNLKEYLEALGQPPSSTTITAPNASAPNNPSMPGGEGQMDIELITSTAQGVPSTFFYSSNDIYTGFLDWAVEVATISNPPLVWSCSWGTPEKDKGPDGLAFITRATEELIKMGVRGMTLAFASGDAGATAAGRGGQCGVLQPGFPASSPYVLSVSGTVLASANGQPVHADTSTVARDPTLDDTLPYCNMTIAGVAIGCNGPDPTVGATEVPAACCSDGTVWTTGGGFSTMFPRPAYQNALVEQYLKSNAGSLPPSGAFNASNHGYPDVAALSDQVLVYIGDTFSISGGTSAATPYTAGLMALMNSARLSSGRPPLGPVAPLLYKLAVTNPEAFQDVTTGSNHNGELIRCPPSSGYTAAPGWDPVSGLGSLNVERLLQLI